MPASPPHRGSCRAPASRRRSWRASLLLSATATDGHGRPAAELRWSFTPATLPYVGNNVQARITVPRCVSPDVKVTVVAVDTGGNQFGTDSVTVKVGMVPC